LPLPCPCSSPPGLAFSAPTAAATSPQRTVVSAQCGSVSVVEATYLGRVFNAAAMRPESARALGAVQPGPGVGGGDVDGGLLADRALRADSRPT
jgi:hypothetical protein